MIPETKADQELVKTRNELGIDTLVATTSVKHKEGDYVGYNHPVPYERAPQSSFQAEMRVKNQEVVKYHYTKRHTAEVVERYEYTLPFVTRLHLGSHLLRSLGSSSCQSCLTLLLQVRSMSIRRSSHY